MEGISGVPAPIPHSKVAGPDKVHLAGSGSGGGLRAQPVNQPLVPVASGSEVAKMSPSERAEYIRSVGQQATARAVAKVIDILA
ncbi:hypothetical protein GCM10017083_48940 [Thalassobaculum fulvum]|jgi:hypothetical protein|uniref:Uncharacterized protein n=1 Tax=Thalassobaculum fulvum TaxID=1633335 RepID=A0A919CSA4_9PROT|nr:hypothetical protein [Thalassobaculum fulvum]GHD61512.1 hypothetical protein GCM10017083_48940 [Thalassobaculum fulvum]